MKKVLIIEDDPALAELVADFCRGADFDARIVTESPRAASTALEWQPNLITLDLEMPEMDGIEVLRQLQSCPETARIPVVVISVVARGALEQGLLKGARMAFEKPLRLQRLIAKLQELISFPRRGEDFTRFEPSPKHKP